MNRKAVTVLALAIVLALGAILLQVAEQVSTGALVATWATWGASLGVAATACAITWRTAR